MYKLIGSPMTRAFRVMWMLEELAEAYDIDPAGPQSEAARAVNPSGKVPALKVGDDVIIDSVAICQFLADSHGKLTFPAGTIDRAKQDSWTQFASDDIEAPLWFNAKHSFVLPEELRSEAALKACKYDFDRAIQAFEERLGANTYVMGDTFTVPDIILGHCANWAQNSAGWDIQSRSVTEYFDRLRARPAYTKTMETRKRITG